MLGGHNRLDDFAGGVKNQGMPKVAGDGFVALAAFAVDGQLDGLGDAVRGFVEEHFEGFGALIARIETGNGDAQGIERGVGASPVGVGGNVHADFVLGPARLINVGEAFAEADTLFADQRSDARNPAAIGAVVVGPEVRAINGGGGVQNLGELGRETRVAGLFSGAGELVAIFKIAELVFQQEEFGAEEQVLRCVVGHIIGYGIVPGSLLDCGKGSARGTHDRESGFGGFVGGFMAGGRVAALAGFLIERVVEVDPETAMEFENRQWSIGGIDLGSGLRSQRQKQSRHQQQRTSCENRAHVESHDSNANAHAAQIFCDRFFQEILAFRVLRSFLGLFGGIREPAIQYG